MSGFTTNETDQLEAAAMRTDTGGGKGQKMIHGLAEVELGSGVQKYVLIKTPSGYLVRGNPSADYHKDAARGVVGTLQDEGVSYTILGGGRIHKNDDKKTILIYGHSYGFPWDGPFRHDISATLVEKAFPEHSVTTSDEGY